MMEERLRYSKQELLSLQEAGEEEGQWQCIAAAIPPGLLNQTSEPSPPYPRGRKVDRRQGSKHHVPAPPEASPCAITPPLFLQPRESVDEEMCSLDGYVNHTDEEEDASDDSEDEVSLQPLAFMVDGKPDFESGSPQDGFEYLRRVMWEAAQCPKVKVAKIGETKVIPEQTKYMPEIAPILTCSPNLLPSKDWVHAFLKDFSALREVISSTSALEDYPEVLPPIRNRSVWKSVCFGESRNRSSDVSSDEHDDGCARPDPFPALNGHAKTHSPYLKLLLRLDENSRATLFRYHASWLNEQRQLAYDRAMWLFALAAAVDSPLDDQTSAAFRDMLRKCAELRSQKTVVDEELYMLNILITIAGEFFGQAEDVWMICA
ncbi:hypothetical protein GOP47_0002625 [Adiantum capillus-veneris]|uniref:Gem-associated protein 2 n=1 Tax=Adiantum capillus-veneris TaxID=13818 RepID=A0A9D4ZRF7_ADICA|nr:hypothetical protein GOP47_0002625 [Adiantum capillus-veneris]